MSEHDSLETKAGGSSVGAAFEDFMRAFEAFKETNDERLYSLERRSVADPLLEDKLTRIDRALDEHRRVVDELALKAARPPIGGVAPRSGAALAHKAAFDGYVRKGDPGALRDLERKALSVGSDPDGGFLVPDETEKAVNRALKDISPIRAIAGIRQVSGSLYKRPFSIAGPSTGWVAETASRPQTNAPTLDELSFPTTELYAMPAATPSLLDDSAVNIDEWLADVVRIDGDGGSRLFRVTEIGERGEREIAARSIDPDVYGGVATKERPVSVGGPVLSGRPLVEFLDLPLLRGDEPPAAGYAAATQTPWPGGVAIYGSPETTGYTLKALASAPATVGTTLDDLSEGPGGRLDHGTRLRVLVEGEELGSVTQLQLLAGRNVAAVRNADGEWEVLQFQSAELIAPGTYELSELLRGQSGSEFAMRSAVAAGARFVLINTAVARVDVTAAEIRLPYSWRVGPATRDIGDASYATVDYTFAGLGLKPLSPVHVRSSRAGGDVAITWLRRTRIGGDGWEAPEVPLGEDTESYEVDILDGASVKRTLVSATPAVTYTGAQQTADFGAAQPAYDVRAYQLSATYGRGTPRDATV